MNGIDAVAVATGNDWRVDRSRRRTPTPRATAAIARSPRGRIEDRHLVGSIELPMAVSHGRAGGRVASARAARVPRARRQLGARELGGIMAAVGLASNMAAMRALATEGIQKGHMALHARAVSHAAGARARRRRSCGSG